MSHTFFSHLVFLVLAFTFSASCGPSMSLPNPDSPRSCVEQSWDPLWTEFGRNFHCSSADFEDLETTTDKARQQKEPLTRIKKGARKRTKRIQLKQKTAQRVQKKRQKKRRRSCITKKEPAGLPKSRVGKRLKCPLCSSKSNDVYYLARHFIQHHEQEACPYTCHYSTTPKHHPCKSKLVDTSCARAHLRKHLELGLFPVPDDQFKRWIKQDQTKEATVANRLKKIRTWLIVVNKATE